MFEEDNKEKRPELDAAWANETQRFETIFHHKDDPTADPISWDDQDEYPVDEGLINTQEDEGWDKAWDDFYLKTSDDEEDDLDLYLGLDDDLSDEYDDDLEGDKADPVVVAPAPTVAAPGSQKGGKHAAKPVSRREKRRAAEENLLKDLPEHMVKSHRMRKTLLLVLILLVVVLGGIAVFATTIVATQRSQAVQETADSVSDGDQTTENSVAEGGRSSRKTEVPNLTELFGLTEDEAIDHLGHGATESGSYDVDETDNPIKKNVSLILADEPSDTKSGTPTVFLGLDEDGKVVMAGYCAATASLGYGALSFTDLVENEHVIEQTLSEAGIGVETGSVTLPDDPSDYQSFDSDGVTLVRESYSFDGEGVANDTTTHDWSGVLTYDYTAANASGNLADTVRQVYIYVRK